MGGHFNPRSPHGERRRRRSPSSGRKSRFQSTLPARGATQTGYGKIPKRTDFNPRSPHGERRQSATRREGAEVYFNPRSPHGERRSVLPEMRQAASHFNPRSPHGERLFTPRSFFARPFYFNPRSPHGERQRKVTILSIRIIGFAQKVYHKTVLLRISLAENAVILPEKPRNPVRTSLQKAGGLRFARAIRAAHPYSISSPSGA